MTIDTALATLQKFIDLGFCFAHSAGSCMLAPLDGGIAQMVPGYSYQCWLSNKQFNLFQQGKDSAGNTVNYPYMLGTPNPTGGQTIRQSPYQVYGELVSGEGHVPDTVEVTKLLGTRAANSNLADRPIDKNADDALVQLALRAIAKWPNLV